MLSHVLNPSLRYNRAKDVLDKEVNGFYSCMYLKLDVGLHLKVGATKILSERRENNNCDFLTYTGILGFCGFICLFCKRNEKLNRKIRFFS